MASLRGLVHAWKLASQRVVSSMRGLSSVSCAVTKATKAAPSAAVAVAVATKGPAIKSPALARPWLQSTRQFSTYSSFNSNPRAQYQSFRYKTKFFHHFHTKASPIFHRLKWHSFVFHNFSQAYSNTYRLRLHHSSLNFTTKTFFNRIRRSFGVSPTQPGQNLFLAQPTVPLALRLNRLLSADNHRITLTLAKRESEVKQVTGCYLEFRLDCKVAIPGESLYTEETQSEIKRSLAIQRRRLAMIEDSLDKLAEIGELPITCDDQVIRFYFPNCDRARLEALLLDREISAGVIVEDYESVAQSESPSQQVSEWDVLSSSGYLTSDSSAAGTATVLSDDLPLDTPFVTLDAVPTTATVEIHDDFHWV